VASKPAPGGGMAAGVAECYRCATTVVASLVFIRRDPPSLEWA
jgi:hypothetical protein